jgi:hypothetical protein
MKLEPDFVLALTAAGESLVSQKSHPVHKAMGPVMNGIDSALRHILAWLECSHFAPRNDHTATVKYTKPYLFRHSSSLDDMAQN